MRNIINSCFGKSEQLYVDYLTMFIEEADSLKRGHKIDILSDTEREYFKYLINSFESAGYFPTNDLFEKVFPETEGQFISAKIIQLNDLRVYIFNLIDRRVNQYIAQRISELNLSIQESGMTDEITNELGKLQGLSNRNKAKDIKLDINARSEYEIKKIKPDGLQTGVNEVDERIGGISPGNVTTIAGFTSQYKTTFSLNIAHINSYYLGYNIAYITLETPKDDMYWNLLSCHSYETKFPKYQFIGHSKMRRATMTKDEEDYLFNEIEPDLKDDYIGEDGKTHKRGKVVFLDESDFKSFSFGEIAAVLEKVDEQLDGKLDAVIVDYIQLCKFSGSGMTTDANAQINSYVTFFRRLAQNFRKVVKEDGTEETKQLAMILLAQINRGSWQTASKNDGVYNITCLADANELERGSAVVLTTYTSEELKARKTAQVQILKNRTGQTMIENPAQVFADGEAYVFMSEDGMDRNVMADGSATMDSALSSLTDDDFDDLGF